MHTFPYCYITEKHVLGVCAVNMGTPEFIWPFVCAIVKVSASWILSFGASPLTSSLLITGFQRPREHAPAPPGALVRLSLRALEGALQPRSAGRVCCGAWAGLESR